MEIPGLCNSGIQIVLLAESFHSEDERLTNHFIILKTFPTCRLVRNWLFFIQDWVLYFKLFGLSLKSLVCRIGKSVIYQVHTVFGITQTLEIQELVK